jgi:hypothetical protein
MGKAKGPKRKTGDPYLVAILFCDSVIEEKQDGTVTLVRVIDHIDIAIPSSAPPDFPSETNRVLAEFVAYSQFKTGGSPGRHTVHFEVESPRGKKEHVFEQTVDFPESQYAGAGFTLYSKVRLYKGGVFRLHVYLDGKHVGQSPIQILVHRPQGERYNETSSEQGQAHGKKS